MNENHSLFLVKATKTRPRTVLKVFLAGVNPSLPRGMGGWIIIEFYLSAYWFKMTTLISTIGDKPPILLNWRRQCLQPLSETIETRYHSHLSRRRQHEDDLRGVCALQYAHHQSTSFRSRPSYSSSYNMIVISIIWSQILYCLHMLHHFSFCLTIQSLPISALKL